MAALALMERDNLLQLGRLKELFNPALPPGQRLRADMLGNSIAFDRMRLAGIRRHQFMALTG
jgi:hypothetical protein